MDKILLGMRQAMLDVQQNADFQHQARKQAALLKMKDTFYASMASLLLSVWICYYFWQQLDQQSLLVFLALRVLLHGLWNAYVFPIPKRWASSASHQAVHVYRGFDVCFSCLDGLLWGVLFAWLLMHASLAESSMVLLLVAGLFLGALHRYAFFPGAYACFLLTIFIPIVFAIIYFSEDVFVPMIWLVLLLTLLLFFSSLRQYKLFIQKEISNRQHDQLFEQINDHNQLLSLLAKDQKLNDVVQAIETMGQRQIPLYKVHILLLDDETGFLKESEACKDADVRVIAAIKAYIKQQSQHFVHYQTYIVANSEDDVFWCQAADLFASCLLVPVYNSKQVLIASLFLHSSKKGAYSEVICTLAEGLASLTGLMLEHVYDKDALHFSAYHDVLTKLPNRGLFKNLLHQSMRQKARQQSPLSVLFIDIDKFKQINDELGHHAGDLVLIAVADRFQLLVRGSDILSRWAGDEFVLLLDTGDTEVIQQIAQKMLKAIQEPIPGVPEAYQSGCSIGAAVYQQENFVDEHALINAADMAMYAAKKKGGNALCFYHEGMSHA